MTVSSSRAAASRVTFLLVLTIIVSGAPRLLHAATCSELIAGPPTLLLETPAVYKYLRELDTANCPKLAAPDFDAFMERLEVNLVSYVLLENRLSEAGTGLGKEVVAAYLKQYSDAKAELDDNAILPLIDIAYYECRGEQQCIREKVVADTQALHITASAACFYAMTATCTPAEVRPNFYFLNDATLAKLTTSKNASAERAQFICRRYGDCVGKGFVENPE